MFTDTQLQLIENAARSVKNQGELAVYKRIISLPEEDFSLEQLNIIKYCAEECKRQRSGELSVYWMIYAWNAAQKEFTLVNPPPFITIDSIEYFGQLVEPHKNVHGIRSGADDRVGIYNGWKWEEKTPPDRVRFQLENLLEAYYNGDLMWHYKENRPSNPLAKTAEDQFYYEYEEIHPFMDGNGRTGKIIYNYLKGTLDNPVMPPNFFGGSNP